MPVRIPLLDPVQSGGQVSQIDASSATAPARAVAQGAQAVGQGLYAGLETIEEAQKLKNDGKFSDLKAQARQAAMAYDQTLATNKDPTSWAPGFNKAMDSWKGAQGLESLPPDVRAQFGRWENEFRSTQGLKYQEQGSIFSIEQSKVAKDNSVQRAMDMADFGGAIKEIETDSLLSPAEKDRGIYKVQQREAKYNLENDINDDPKGTLKELESDSWLKDNPGASPELRQWGQDQARIAFQRKQKDALRGLTSEIEMGQIVTEDQLKERLAKEEYIEPEMHDEAIFHFRQSKPLDQETRFALTDGLNGLHDAYKSGELTLEEYRTAHDGVGQIIYSMGARDGAGELRQRLHNLDPTNWGPAKSPKDTRMQTVQKLGQLFETSGAFGSVSNEDIEKMSPFDVASKRTGIFNAREATEKAMESWLQSPEGKDANEEQISDKFKDIFLDKAAAKILRPGGAWATQPEVEDYINNLKNPADPKGASSQIKSEPVGTDLTSMVKHFEAGGEKSGFHSKAYWDYGQWSIGYGTRAKQGEVIDQAEAEKRLDAELSVHKNRVLSANEKLKLQLDPHQIDALTSFDYNTGKLETLLAGGTRDKDTIASMMLQYKNAKGTFLPGLLARRKAESSLFRNGYKGAKKQVKEDPAPVAEANSSEDPALNTGEFEEYNVIQDG